MRPRRPPVLDESGRPMRTIVETVDTLAGERIVDAVLPVRKTVRLSSGQTRFICDRPGGGTVEVVR